MNVIDKLDPDYLKAYAKYGSGEKADDIGIALWGLNKTIALDVRGDGQEPRPGRAR